MRRSFRTIIAAPRAACCEVCTIKSTSRRESAASPSFGKWVGVELSADNKRMLWVPPGLGHGFLTLEDGTDFLYKCTEYYSPKDERSIRWDDPTIGIAWPLDGMTPRLSAKDEAGRSLSEAEIYE